MSNDKRRPAAIAPVLAAAYAAAAATTLLLLPTNIAAQSSECQPSPDSRTPPFTGYLLQSGSSCRRYVYCSNGILRSRLDCPDGLLFDVDGGICTWASSVDCPEDDPGNSVSAQGADDGNWAASVSGVSAKGGAMAGTEEDGGGQFCGVDLADAESRCDRTCLTSADCSSPAEACFSTGSSCDTTSSVSNEMINYLSANNNNVLAPSGGNSNNPNSFGTILESSLDNPNDFYCGSSPANAAEICRACPGGTMAECGDDFTHGCFAGIAACSAAGGNSGTMNNSGSNNGRGSASMVAQGVIDSIGNDPQEELDALGWGGDAGQMIPMQQLDAGEIPKQVTAEPTPRPTSKPTTSPPTLSPTLPPWTNAPFNPSPSLTPKTVIGYYASWQWYDRDKLADPQNVDFSKYDRINYAFFQPCEQGNLYGTDEWGDPQILWGPYVNDESLQYDSGPNANRFCSWDGPSLRNCNYHDTSKGLVYLAHAAGAEVMPSIGGWTLSDNFPGIAASASRRQNFARNCADLIDAYGFDGIDIDWEYPGYADHSGTPEDTENFTLLLEAVRSKLDQLGRARGKFYGLTAALPCGPDKIAKIQVDRIKNILTELNLMSYDLHGAWDTLTGTNAPMFDQGWTDETPRWSVHGCVNNYVDLGVSLSQMNVGLPFYGRSFQGAMGMKQFHGGVDDINWHLDEGSPQYFNIVNELGRMTTYRHENTQTQYAAFDNGGVVSYDDPRAICDKVAYANERGMHGFLIWEISGDMIDRGNGVVETPLIDATNTKIQNPGFDCSTLRDPSWALRDGTYRYAPDEPDSVDWENYVVPLSAPGSGNDYDGAQSGRNQGADNSDLSVDDCPLDFTGYYASAGCAGYVYCQDGEVVGASQPCVPGTLFDVTIGVCQWAASVAGCGR